MWCYYDNFRESKIIKMAERIARALNLLGTNRDLLSTDSDVLLELIDDYWANDSDAVNEGMSFLLCITSHILLKLQTSDSTIEFRYVNPARYNEIPTSYSTIKASFYKELFIQLGNIQ